MKPSRGTVLAGVFAGVAILAAVLLMEVLGTVVFAVTLAYVLYPVRRWAVERGLSQRWAAAATTTLAGIVGIVLISPVLFVVYQRRQEAIEFVQSLPDELPVTLGDMTYVIETAPLVDQATAFLTDLAVEVARAAPIITLEAIVLVLVTFGVLYRPQGIRQAVVGVVPQEYHDVVGALHRRTADTLQAIYVLQAATALGTFLLALLVFGGLGYESPVFLSVLAGVLQFIPVLGPSVLVLTLAAVEFTSGQVVDAVIITVIGLIVIGFLPDAVIRTRLAGYAADLPVALYFVGFVGGVLTVGAIGFVLGPLVVALLSELVSLLSAEAERGQGIDVDEVVASGSRGRSAGGGSRGSGVVGEVGDAVSGSESGDDEPVGDGGSRTGEESGDGG